MYVPPLASWNAASGSAPAEYHSRARAKIAQTLHANINLKYGSSPLKESLNASNLEVSESTSNDTHSINSNSSDQSVNSKKKSFFSPFKLKNNKNPSDTISTSPKKRLSFFGSSSSHESVTSSDSMDIDSSEIGSSNMTSEPSIYSVSSTITPIADQNPYTQNEYLDGLRNLHQIPSISSMATSNHDSVFSSQSAPVSANTNLTTFSSHNYEYTKYFPQSFIGNSFTSPPVVKIEDIIPTDFSDMYSPELLIDTSLLINGRPAFTKRDLIDWDLNDLRSLLIVEHLRVEWGNQLPIILNPSGFKIQCIALNSSDDVIIDTLVHSDIYKEAKFDESFRLQTARYTVQAARLRHRQIIANAGLKITNNVLNSLSKPEWRNIIENFLLNLAVEAQCRYDFKKNCSMFKKQKRQSLGIAEVTPTSNSLLRKALLNGSMGVATTQSDKLTKEEKSQIWINTQTEVYRRVGLDWAPDQLR